MFVISRSKSLRQPFITFEGWSDTDPEKLLWVSPEEIQHSFTCLERHQLEKFGGVYSGPWDTAIGRTEELPYYISFKKHFLRGIDWEDTEYYQDKIDQLRETGSTDRHGSTSDLEERLRFLDRLAERIQSEGYKTQRELLAERPSETADLNNDAPEPELNEIGVCIARDGTLIRDASGAHRFYLARILGIEEIPVQVRIRHKKWQQIRDSIKNRRKNVASDLRSHPDLQDLI